jgi:uncharacterized protein with von Willebrand factor type A (vWA) domain
MRELGYRATAVWEELGLDHASRLLSELPTALGRADALGDERRRTLRDAFAEELDHVRSLVREHVSTRLSVVSRDAPRSEDGGPMDVPFSALTEQERGAVHDAVRALAARLRGALRKREARRGALDVGRTLRKNLRYGGTPVDLHYRKRHRERPSLVLLCDVSESVRAASSFLLELVYALGNILQRTRSFVFVSELVETSKLFRNATPTAVIGRILNGELLERSSESNYGNALRSFEELAGRDLGPRTALVILGDGRNNFLPDDGRERMVSLRKRVGTLLWVCPEAPESWGTGDSRMPVYAKAATRVIVARTARELEQAARSLLGRRATTL